MTQPTRTQTIACTNPFESLSGFDPHALYTTPQLIDLISKNKDHPFIQERLGSDFLLQDTRRALRGYPLVLDRRRSHLDFHPAWSCAESFFKRHSIDLASVQEALDALKTADPDQDGYVTLADLRTHFPDLSNDTLLARYELGHYALNVLEPLFEETPLPPPARFSTRERNRAELLFKNADELFGRSVSDESQAPAREALANCLEAAQTNPALQTECGAQETALQREVTARLDVKTLLADLKDPQSPLTSADWTVLRLELERQGQAQMGRSALAGPYRMLKGIWEHPVESAVVLGGFILLNWKYERWMENRFLDRLQGRCGGDFNRAEALKQFTRFSDGSGFAGGAKRFGLTFGEGFSSFFLGYITVQGLTDGEPADTTLGNMGLLAAELGINAAWMVAIQEVRHQFTRTDKTIDRFLEEVPQTGYCTIREPERAPEINPHHIWTYTALAAAAGYALTKGGAWLAGAGEAIAVGATALGASAASIIALPIVYYPTPRDPNEPI